MFTIRKESWRKYCGSKIHWGLKLEKRATKSEIQNRRKNLNWENAHKGHICGWFLPFSYLHTKYVFSMFPPICIIAFSSFQLSKDVNIHTVNGFCWQTNMFQISFFHSFIADSFPKMLFLYAVFFFHLPALFTLSYWGKYIQRLVQKVFFYERKPPIPFESAQMVHLKPTRGGGFKGVDLCC